MDESRCLTTSRPTGTISPGVNGTATFEISDNLSFSTGAKLALELNGTALGAYDQLSVSFASGGYLWRIQFGSRMTE